MSESGSPLPVACVSVSAALGGSEWVLLDFVSRAASLGVEATVVLPKDGPLGAALQAAGVAVAVVPAETTLLEMTQRAMLSPDGLLRFGRGLGRWSRAIAAAVAPLRSRGGAAPLLYSNGFKAHLACALLRGHRHVWHLHEFPPERLDIVWRTLAAVLPDARIANSEAVANAWARGAHARPVVVGNGVDLERFRPSAKRYWIHDQLALSHEARLIGMPAVFARWKGHLKVVEAFERAAGRLDDVHLVLVGGPIYDTVAEQGYAEELVRRVRRSSASGGSGPQPLSDRIHFLKFDPEPWRLYPEFDLVVHFSTRPEPFGRVIAEAMASGVPVIAADAGGPREIVEDGVTGWRVPPNDVLALSDCMVKALEADAGPMRVAARRAAEQRLSADRFAREVAEVLRRVGAP
jgi:glycosyltransferase involved in cell wall biosynthesis